MVATQDRVGGVAKASAGRAPQVIDVWLRYLKAEGVSVVFGVPGGLLYPFFDNVEADADIRLVVTKHEQGAAFMADGYARSSGRLSVCAATGGPGATNLLTGVSCAYADGVPMLVVTGQAASHAIGKGAAQETSREDIDIVAMFRPVTKYSAHVGATTNVSLHLRRALRLALTGKPGPVHLNVPVELWEKPLEEDWFDPRTYRPRTHTFDRQAVRDAAGALLAAERPVILAGAGVAIAGAEEHLLTLAELLPARVATTPRGKGVFPEDHALSLGVLGVAGHAQARETVFGDDVDVLFTVGASLNETTTGNWDPRLRPRGALVQLDVSPDPIGRNYPVDHPLLGDAQTILVELVYHLHRLIRDGHSPRARWDGAAPLDHGPGRYDHPDLRASDRVPMTPQRWRCDLQEALPDNAVVFSDIGGHMLFNLHDLCIRKGQKFVLNLGFGSMGHGTAAPVGAALALPDRPIVTIVGDACFTMNGMELHTALEAGAKVVWIVENNNMHGVTLHAGPVLGRSGRVLRSIVYRHPLEVASIARAMGLAAWVVDRPGQLQGTMREALAADGPCLIEVRVDASVSPPLGARVRSLAGFFGRDQGG
jgi:acetolactate synthase-1/2/3 large subunit